ncbi:G2/mitotic-specific cyclin-B2-like [Atheta coriaria]|uniref:G2/mitotic-specific cyclin-B2-like n=1 Tax=Dalotia coriaria TaxID=877792 RepID=UPI0031F45707
MDRIKGRRRIGVDNVQENNPRQAVATAKLAINPKPVTRTVFDDVGNQAPRPILASKTNALNKPTKPQPLATTRTVFGAVKKEKESLLKPALKKPVAVLKKPVPAPSAVQVAATNAGVPTTKGQIKKVMPDAQIKQLMPTIQNTKLDIAKAFNAGKIIEPISRSNAVPYGIRDVDLEDDPQLVCEYIKDIMRYLLDLEDKYPIAKNHLKGLKVTEKHRAVLIDWIVEVLDSFKLTKETLYMSVSLIDRYLALNHRITKDNLQLVGIVAMFIAHKYEELNIVGMDDWLYICDDAYKSSEILSMEMHMLHKMDFCLGRPTAITFLRRYHKVIMASLRQHELGKYLIELALIEYDLSAVKPSVHAAAACCLAHWLVEMDGGKPADSWSDILKHYSGYKYSDIASTVMRYAVMALRAETAKQQGVRKLYSDEKRQRIALDEVLRSARLKAFVAATAQT